MEREPQFFKTPEIPEKKSEPSPEISDEVSELKPEEVITPETESKTETEKFKAELGAGEKAEREKAKFFGKIQKEEQEMAGGILRKFAKAPKELERGLMILAAVSVFFGAGKAFAGGEQWQRTHQGWQKIIQWDERQQVDYPRQQADRQRFEAYQDYLKQEQAIKQIYEQRKFDIMIGRVPGATDYFGKERAYRELEEWRINALNKARRDWSLKVWAAEEQYRMEKMRQGGR